MIGKLNSILTVLPNKSLKNSYELLDFYKTSKI